MTARDPLKWLSVGYLTVVVVSRDLAPVTIVPHDPDFLKRIKDALRKDPEIPEILQLLRSDRQSSDKFSLADYEVTSDGLLMFQGLIYVPNETELQLSILKAYHDHPTQVTLAERRLSN
ncbi:hypothetical protein V1507DRAFT_445758 [Lipomyces tetrasporus]